MLFSCRRASRLLGLSSFCALCMLGACSFDPYANADYCRDTCRKGTHCFHSFCVQDDARVGSASDSGTIVPAGSTHTDASRGRAGIGNGVAAGSGGHGGPMTHSDGGAAAGNPSAAVPLGTNGGGGAMPSGGAAPPDNGGGSAPGTGGGASQGPAGSSGGGAGGSGGGPPSCTPLSTTDGCTVSGMALDDDCDGLIDEDCRGCMEGQQQDCYAGSKATLGVGPCRAGKQTCSMASFGPCQGAVTPQSETCANPNTDDDCDGITDNVSGAGGACTVSSAAGICRPGALRCSAGASLVCVSNVSPMTETCNGRDDDCDGKTDEDFDFANDTAHCGACDRACATGQSCCAGQCATLASDPSHCGTCSLACSNGGACCGGSCIDLQTSNGNCGACGTDCGLLNLGGVICQCQAGKCAAPLGLCLL